MKPLITLTGISGFVGMRIATQALNDGYRVRATLRDLDQANRVQRLIGRQAPVDELSFTEATLTDDKGWAEAMIGADFVIHTASPLILGKVLDESILFAPAVDGTKRVLQAAKKAKVKRIVVTSTALTMAGHITEGIATAKDFTPIDDPRITLYTRSKIAADQVVQEFISSNPDGPEVLSVYPGVIIGPPIDPNEDSESIELFRGIWSGAQPAIPNIPLPMADVRDIAKIHISALTADKMSVSRYIVSFTTEPQYLPDIAKVLRANGNKRAPRLTIPMPVLRILARFNAQLRSLVSSTDGLTLKLDINTTMKDFDWKPISFEQSVIDTASALADS